MSRGPSSRSFLAACGSAALVAVAAPAGAGAAPMASGYEAFQGCPQREEVIACQTIDYATGSFGLGKLTVPVEQAVNFAGGAANSDAGSFYESDAGSVLKPLSLPLPGGAGGLTGDTADGDEAVSVVPELTTAPEFTANGTKLSIRFGFTGAGLPDGCGIGTAEEPVVIELTNGTTTPPEGVEPLTGDPGSAGFDILKMIVKSEKVLFVDNAYAVPAATGCGTSIGGRDVGSVDDRINASAGLPAAAGASQSYARDATVNAAVDMTKVFAS